MSIDLGNNPVGTPPTTGQSSQMRDAIGLGNVDNTSDVNKPVSNPTLAIIDSQVAKLSAANVFTENQSIYGNLSANTVNIGSTIINEPLTTSQFLVGNNAGYQATNANNSNFLGENAGYLTTDAEFSNFLGRNAGNSATYAYHSNFLGEHAGYLATNAPYSNFLGYNAGNSATNAAYSNFLGQYAGNGATNAYSSNFLGENAGAGATNAYSSNFLGAYAGIGVTGSKNHLIGSNTSVLPLSTSNCIVIGDGAVATQNNTIALGSTATPLLTAGSATATGNYLVIRLNGVDLKIPLYI